MDLINDFWTMKVQLRLYSSDIVYQAKFND